MPEITEAVLDGGVVTAHYNFGSDDSGWRSLPNVFQFTTLSVAVIDYLYAPGEFFVQITSPDPIAVSATIAAIDGYGLRVVVLPPGA